MNYFEAIDNPNYSFDILFGIYNLRISVYRTTNHRYVDVYDIKNKKMLSAGKSALHMVNFFKYTNVKANFFYVNSFGRDPVSDADFLNGGFILEYPI